ncbi:hypothetical protein B9Q04_07330 [Candidatus Marsarchaeota G2 archaeon BE_D]|jgi:Pentose-5-phosphate-3-epimerase|uniref:Ribulose-phosphate 3-epimerase n=1 Tax=Candidatus Marsarchaeota G2 archaeon BE_D TaxID=1978158 RepID=A0A2R6CB36_9ARCH|nr:MAG: hypothetical protein B9Q04_07330 [Candidatus Marsarchaeota G2 archaeon BE_D]
MGRVVKIAPSILAANPLHVLEDLRQLEGVGIDLIHVDVIDGVFAPNFGYTPAFIKALASEINIPIDAHLMIVNPLKYVGVFAEAGAEYISVHVESLDASSARMLLNLSREQGFRCGFALRPSTPEPTWLGDILDKADFILPMSVEPGFSGQKFMRTVLPRFKRFSDIRRQNAYSYELEADGGVTQENAAELVGSGVDILVAGSSIFSSGDVKQAAEKLRSACGVYTV